MIPRPPKSFGVHAKVQLARFIFLCGIGAAPCQRNDLLILSMSLITHSGNLRHDMKYVGSDDNTELIKTILPEMDKCLAAHPLSLLFFLWIKGR